MCVAPDTAGVSKTCVSKDKLGGGRGVLHDHRAGKAMETFVFGSLSQGRKLSPSLSQVKRQAVDSQYVSKQVMLS